MVKSGRTDPDYVLGATSKEHDRLKSQADFIDPFTRRLFFDAGLTQGMRVLDIGCGAGDVSTLVSEIVGPTGTVLGVDREENSISMARSRAQSMGHSNIEFIQADFRELKDRNEAFDALVGRLVLMYQPDPSAALRAALGQVRPGGIVAFHEHDLSVPAMGNPALPLRQKVSSWLWKTFAQSGAETSMGFKLYSTFSSAGLLAPNIISEALLDTPESSYSWAMMTRVMLPKMIKYGVATEQEVDIETLDDRLRREIEGSDKVSVGFLAFGAWARVPD